MLGVWPGPAEIPGILSALPWPVGPGAIQGHYLAIWPRLWVLDLGWEHTLGCLHGYSELPQGFSTALGVSGGDIISASHPQ